MRYVGWAVPEAVYIDFDVIQNAPPVVNRSGICEILCYHTAHADWRYAQARGKVEAKWQYDQTMVAEAQAVLATVMDALDDIRAVNEKGIRTLMLANRWGGAAFHNLGWNPRPIEGADHFLFYALEYHTGKKFIHGQPVCLGIYIGSLLHDDRAPEMLAAILRAGVDIRPEAMDISWEDVGYALLNMRQFVRDNGLWYGIYHDATIDQAFVDRVRANVAAAYAKVSRSKPTLWNHSSDRSSLILWTQRSSNSRRLGAHRARNAPFELLDFRARNCRTTTARQYGTPPRCPPKRGNLTRCTRC